MAKIEKNPLIEDCFEAMTLPEIAARGGVADLVEDGRLVLIDGYRLDFDFGALAVMDKSIDQVTDPMVYRKLKKLVATQFFAGEPPLRRRTLPTFSDLMVYRKLKKLVATQLFAGEPPLRRRKQLTFSDPVRQAIFDVLCRGDVAIFDRAARALKGAHQELERIFGIAFPGYEPFHFIPSLRVTRTLFENLHWDNHSIDDDFHQSRIFANLDVRPRIWNIGENLIAFMENHYDAFDLGRFAGRDPNDMLNFIHADVLGGFDAWWKDTQPRHRIAFDPGEVWLGESRFLSHQIVYGECAMVYMWFMRFSSMHSPDRRFNLRVEDVHRRMAERSTRVA